MEDFTLEADNSEFTLVVEAEYTDTTRTETKSVSFRVDSTDRDLIRKLADEELADRVGDESNWQIRSTAFEFDNPPWSDPEDMADLISKKCSGVSYTRYISPLVGRYGPPKIVVNPTDKGRISQLVQEIEDTFPRVKAHKTGGKISVVVAATAHLD